MTIGAILPLLNGVGVNYNLTTWHGAANRSSLSSQDVHLLILDVVLQDGPIALLHVRLAGIAVGDHWSF